MAVNNNQNPIFKDSLQFKTIDQQNAEKAVVQPTVVEQPVVNPNVDKVAMQKEMSQQVPVTQENVMPQNYKMQPVKEDTPQSGNSQQASPVVRNVFAKSDADVLNDAVKGYDARRNAEQTAEGNQQIYGNKPSAATVDNGQVAGANIGGADAQTDPRLNPTLGAGVQQNVATAKANIGRPTYRDFRDAMFGDENARLKRARARAGVAAIGDALRHIGNLAFTIGHASPQQYKYNPATAELQEYEKGRKERDAMGYQELQNWQKQRQLDIQNGLAKQKMAQDQFNKDRDYGLKAREDQRKQELHPYTLGKLEGDAKAALANGDIKTYEATIKKLEADNTPEAIKLKNALDAEKVKTEKARQSQAYASAANSRASAALTNEKKKQLTESIKKGKKFWMPTDDDNYMWEIDEAHSKYVGNKMKGIAKKKMSKWNGSADLENIKDADLLTMAYEHLDDPEIQSLLNDYGKKVASNREKTTDIHNFGK